MNEGYSPSCWCVVIVLTYVVDSWEKLSGPPKTMVVITILNICMMVGVCLNEFNFETVASIIHDNWNCEVNKKTLPSTLSWLRAINDLPSI